MPELRFDVRWPDGTRQLCYSPSTIVREYFEAGAIYTLADFVGRSRAALTAASERVRAVHGMPCSVALAELASIETAASRYKPDANVIFVSFKE